MNKLKTIDIKGKKYVDVAERVRYFNETYPKGMLVTKIVKDEPPIIMMKAIAYPDASDKGRYFVGFAYEKEGSTFINKTSYVENCQTSAVGRSLGLMGIGIDTSIASADEVGNAMAQQNNPQKFIQPQPKSDEDLAKEIDEADIDPEIDAKDKLIAEICEIGKDKGYSAGDIRANMEKKYHKDLADITIEELEEYLGLIKRQKPKI